MNSANSHWLTNYPYHGKGRNDQTSSGRSCGIRISRPISVILMMLLFAIGDFANPLQTACGLRINLTFTNPYNDPNNPNDDDESRKYYDPSGADHTKDLIAIMKAARDVWEDIIEDPYTLNITYEWGNLSDPNKTLGLHTNQGTNAGRPTNALIQFDTKIAGANRLWYFDPTPNDSSEFNMQQTLVRDLTGSQPANFYNGSPPDLLEVSYAGAARTSAPTAAQKGTDLFSVALHEIGHALGMTGAVAASETNDFDYDYNSAFDNGKATAAKSASTTDRYHLAASGAMFPNIGTGQRILLSATDVFSVATAPNPGWASIDLPRQDYWGGFDLNDPMNWEGNRVPGTEDDAWVRTGSSVAAMTSYLSVRNLTVTEGSWVTTADHALLVGETATIDGTGSGLSTRIRVSSGGALSAPTGDIVLSNTGILDLEGGLARGQHITIDDSSRLEGHGSVNIENKLVNNGIIRALDDAELLLFSTKQSNPIDLDGGGHGVVEVRQGDIHLQQGLSDPFSGTMTISNGHFLTSDPKWIQDKGSISLNKGTIRGGDFEAGGDINVNGASTSTITANVVFRSTANVNIAASADFDLDGSVVFKGGSYSAAGSGEMFLKGATEYAGGTLSVVGLAHQEGDATVSAPTTFNGSGSWDMDGNNGHTVWKVNDDLTINAARLESGTGNQIFNGRIDLNGSGTTMAVNTSRPWTMDGQLTIRNGTALAGSAQMNVTGEVFAQSGRIEAPVAFKSGSSVFIDRSRTLQLDGTTYYEGGTFRGATLHQDGTANVIANTTLGQNTYIVPPGGGSPTTQSINWLEQYDWDGNAGSLAVTNISSGVTFTINAVKIDDDPSTNGYGGTVNINGGTLVVNTGARIPQIGLTPGAPAPAVVTPYTSWRLDGTMNLREREGNPAVVASESHSGLHIFGSLNALGGRASVIGMSLTLEPSGQINVANDATLTTSLYAYPGNIRVADTGLLRLTGATVGRGDTLIDGTVELTGETHFYGGNYHGEGRLKQLGDARIYQVDTRLDVFAEFMAGGTNMIDWDLEFQLAKGGIVERKAFFEGNGILHNLADSELVLQDDADVGVMLLNDGDLSLGRSPASAIVDWYTQTGNGILDIEIGGTGVDEFDTLSVSNEAELGGVLDVSLAELIPGEGVYLPSPSDSFPFLTFANYVGQFSNAMIGSRIDTSDGLGSFLLSYGVSAGRPSLLLSDFLATTLSGDFDHDGDRDGRDFLSWQRGRSAHPRSPSDRADWEANFGANASPSAFATMVPEPTTFWLATIAVAGLLPLSKRVV